MNTTSTSQEAVSCNPATGEIIGRYQHDNEASFDRMLEVAYQGYSVWAATSVDERIATLKRMAAVIHNNLEDLASMATAEMGKPITQSRAEVAKCASLCEWYAENGAAMLADETTSIPGSKAYVSYLPIGPILAVMPWNFPYWQILRGAIPILLGGNGYVLKHAPNVMGCAYLMERLWKEAGLPAGAFTVANVGNDLVSKAIQDRRIAAVAVTGSVRAGSAIAAQAGAALKRSLLELGGSDPFIVLSDADIDAAVDAAVVGRFQNTGQICIAAKRIIVEKPVHDAFTERFVEKVRNLKVGDPTDTGTYIGPMARYDLRDELAGQVDAAREEGARVLLGAAKLTGTGNFYSPTVLVGVKPGMTTFEQEIFGPVASIIQAENAPHALSLANQSEFGLSGAIWTTDLQLAKDFARKMETGGVFINGSSASDPRVPIGGVKKSGYGRELSHFGLREFMNAQTVWLDRK
jgi:succinate-semialdehyde dehydrogenase